MYWSCPHTGGDNDPNLSVIHSGDYFFVIETEEKWSCFLLLVGLSSYPIKKYYPILALE